MDTTTPVVNSSLNWASNAAEILYSTACVAPGAEAIVAGGQSFTYGELAGRAGAIARVVHDAVEPGDRVAILLRGGVEAAAAFFGVLAAGAVAVNVNESLRPRQVDHILRHAGASLVLTCAELIPRLPDYVGEVVPAVDLAAIKQSDEFGPVRRVAGDVAHVIYTSGSTGLPKGVTISHGNLWAGMSAVVEYLGITCVDRLASLLPFSFDYGLNQLLCAAGTGASLVIERSPVPQRVVNTIARQGVTVLPAVPPLWLQLLKVEAFTRVQLPSLRIMTNTGGRLPTHAVRSLREAQPQAELVLMYGLTEAFRSTYLAPGSTEEKPESIGRAIPGAEVLVLDEDCRPCAPGQVGELVHRGPTVALGYWNDEEATAARFRPNPVRPSGTPDAERVVFSGDLVYRDADGDLFFVGRRDSMIKTQGYRVSPDEVADVLYASGEVAEAVVVAEPDEERGSRIVAYVVISELGDLDRLSLFCKRELPRHMQPGRFEVCAELPRTSSGKFDGPAAVRSQGGDAG